MTLDPHPSSPGSPWIKICGNTSVGDALLAAELGADALGFIFAPSRRRLEPGQAAEITRELPAHVERVGVFASLEAREIARIVEQANLNTVQLHGGPVASGNPEQEVELLRELLPSGTRILQTLHFAVGEDAAATAGQVALQLRDLEQCANAERAEAQGAAGAKACRDDELRVLVDAKVAGVSGGLGVTFDWWAARAIFLSGHSPAAPGAARLILAGGLQPENVAEAIATLRPWGVDVVSGVEAQPGRKDPAKLRSFFRNARNLR